MVADLCSRFLDHWIDCTNFKLLDLIYRMLLKVTRESISANNFFLFLALWSSDRIEKQTLRPTPDTLIYKYIDEHMYISSYKTLFVWRIFLLCNKKVHSFVVLLYVDVWYGDYGTVVGLIDTTTSFIASTFIVFLVSCRQKKTLLALH